MTPPSSPLVRILGTLALAISVAAPATAGGQRHAPAGSGAPPAAAVPRSAPSPAPGPAPAPRSSPGRDSGSDRVQDRGTARTGDTGDRSQTDNSHGSSAAGRRRGNLPATGDAAARTSPPRPPHEGGGGGTIVGYPWWYGGGYFGGYYAYDPWPGWYPPYDPVPSGSAVDGDGGLRLKVKPVEASVYVDGYYVGIVDEFDGAFQRLRLVPGPHQVEVLAPEYETLSFDVMIQPNQTTTYRGEMVRRIQ